jgi:hypothetical protein
MGLGSGDDVGGRATGARADLGQRFGYVYQFGQGLLGILLLLFRIGLVGLEVDPQGRADWVPVPESRNTMREPSSNPMRTP